MAINSTYFTYLAALSAIMVIPCSIAVKGCICVGLANYLSLLDRNGNVAVINFQPPTITMEQSPVVHRSWTLLSGSSDPLLAHHCSYSRSSSNPTTSVNTLAMLLFPITWTYPYNTIHVYRGTMQCSF